MNFEVVEEALGGVVVVRARVFDDERGSFLETWSESAFREIGIGGPFVQDNSSVSRRGVLRGLHWQGPPTPQGKLVRCVFGTVWDVVVDIRAGSPTFGRSFCKTLEGPALPGGGGGAGDQTLLFVPPGFAHGFLALSDAARVDYKCTAPWDRAAEGCLRWDDPELGIPWPVDGADLVLSDKDRAGRSLADCRREPVFHWEGGA